MSHSPSRTGYHWAPGQVRCICRRRCIADSQRVFPDGLSSRLRVCVAIPAPWRGVRLPLNQDVLTYHGGMSSSQRRVLLAKPRGYCAGVDRAVQAVEMALEKFGPPVYVRRQIVHNTHVVSTLEKRGAVFVTEVDEVPPGAVVVFSAHGIAPEVRLDAETPGAARHRRDLPAGDQGAQRGAAVRGQGLRHLAGRPRGARGSGGDGRRGPVPGPPGRRRRRRRAGRGQGPVEGGLAVADDAVGGRDDRDRQRPARALPGPARPAERRHLLRHAEPAGRGQGHRRPRPTW